MGLEHTVRRESRQVRKPVRTSDDKLGASPFFFPERPSGPWTDVATAIESEITMTDQSRAKEFEYGVIATNKAGQGQPSNTVMVVL